MTLFDITRAGAVFNAIQAARESDARAARESGKPLYSEDTYRPNRRHWRERAAMVLSTIL